MSGFHELLTWSIERITHLVSVSRESYGVNPVIFLLLYFGSGPLFYYALYRTARALFKSLRGELRLWSSIFVACSAAPFVYVLLFGSGLPWWTYGIFAWLLIQGIAPLVWKLSRTAPATVTVAPSTALFADDSRLLEVTSRLIQSGEEFDDHYRKFSRSAAARIARRYRSRRRARQTRLRVARHRFSERKGRHTSRSRRRRVLVSPNRSRPGIYRIARTPRAAPLGPVAVRTQNPADLSQLYA